MSSFFPKVQVIFMIYVIWINPCAFEVLQPPTSSSSSTLHLIFGIFSLGPTAIQSGLQGRLCPAAAAAHPTPPLGGGFLTSLVGPTSHFRLLSIPLLPGFQFWPKVWPWNLWTPPESRPQLCPISEVAVVYISAYLWLICLFSGPPLLFLA